MSDRVDLVKWLPAGDCDPPHGLDMRSEHDRKKVEMLVEAFRTAGFDRSKAALVGYVKDGRVQLLSGTHRHRAAEVTGIQLPVVLWLGSDIESSWGDLETWRRIVEDIPVADLLTWTRETVEERRAG
jgi:hypothetical protein